ncbi:MAG TPA: hypothetical protein VKH64_06540 [Candidatus Binatia bacterium]|nr:hypothetical protein [Candidatus Binatia bacterium]
MKRLLFLLFLLAACGAYTYQLRWPEGTTAAQFKKDSDECETEPRTGFADLTNEMNDVGTSMAERDDSRKLWYSCMESRGYALVKAPRGQAASPPPVR